MNRFESTYTTVNQWEARDNFLTTNYDYNINLSIKYLNYSHHDDAFNGRNVRNIVIDQNVTCQRRFFSPRRARQMCAYGARGPSLYARNVANYRRLSDHSTTTLARLDLVDDRIYPACMRLEGKNRNKERDDNDDDKDELDATGTCTIA